jgi:hypothetical protein
MNLRPSFSLKHQHGTQAVEFPVPDLRAARTVADALARKEIIDCNYYSKGDFQGVTQQLFKEDKDGEMKPFVDFAGKGFHDTLIELDDIFFFVDPQEFNIQQYLDKYKWLGGEKLNLKIFTTALGVHAERDSPALHVYCVKLALYAGESLPVAMMFGAKAIVINGMEYKNNTPWKLPHLMAVTRNAHDAAVRYPSRYDTEYSVAAVAHAKQQFADAQKEA